MSSIARTRVLSSAFHRTCLQAHPQVSASIVHSRPAHQDYGSGKGSPVGKKPQKQGPNLLADQEHLGPPPLRAGQGLGSSPTKGTSKGHSTTKDSRPSIQKRKLSTMTTLYAQKKPKSTEGLEPKILNESPPTGEEEPADVKHHNEEFKQRAERAHESVSNEDAERDKVSPKFWSEDKDDKTGGRKPSNQ